MQLLPGTLRRVPMLLPGLAGLVVLCVGLALVGQDPQTWQLVLLLAWFALLGWLHSYRQYRFYADTPRARLRSAPQGYVALSGIGRALPGEPLRAPLNYLPCLWYRLRVEERNSDGKWEVESDETSFESFILEAEDGTRCSVDPQDARIEAAHKDKTVQGDRRMEQWLLIPGTRIHVLGDFRSRNPLEDRASAHAEVGERLAEWKASGEAQARFDQDQNGELDLTEWEAVRTAARAEIDAERAASAALPAYHLLQAPTDGRPFVIADQPPEQVQKRYAWQAAISLLLFFVALAICAWTATHP